MKTPDYLSYERYKKRKNTNPNKRLFIFVVTFFITLLSFSIIVKSLSPDVDVTIGGDTEVEAKDTGLGVKRFIDERLKLIQMEDNTTSQSPQQEKVENEVSSPTETSYEITEESMHLPTEDAEEEQVMPSYSHAPTTSRTPAAQTNIKHEPILISKVYVGRYATIEQARVAQEIVMDSGINVTPFIKDLGGSYTLQLGAYTSRTKAEELSLELRRNGFPAKIIQE